MHLALTVLTATTAVIVLLALGVLTARPARLRQSGWSARVVWVPRAVSGGFGVGGGVSWGR
ncbi:hypothetical protein GCM10009630_55660 [Kribbella jejuensis]|uniref:Uncharacterized protein n=1 Tax=Kribbella jejuensis TaxID=236068 RepID=A0A542EVY5_9ACTN|nr:hypothetical protein [Kribbella jejuensis]TQJ19520.1 hypothetical protein FB475_3690 [Kribbella jejuensis]